IGWGPVNHPQILGIGTANPLVRLTQEQSFYAAGYQGERIRKIFLNSDIDHRHFYLEGTLNRGESSDQLNQRYLRGTMRTGCRAILNCLEAAGTTVQDVDFLAICTCTGYVCPDVGSRLIVHMGFINNVQRASIVGLGCAGALPTMQRAVDFVRANPGRKALVLAVEICSACHFVDNTLETVVGNAICADAYLLCGVIHDWDDRRANRILRNCLRAMARTGRLLIIDMVVPDTDAMSFSKLLDLNMLAMTGGRERTKAEFRALLDAACYELTRIIPTMAPQSLLEAVPRVCN